jgi:hypothetical protein
LLEAKLPIHVSAMTHSRNVDQEFGIVDAIHDTPIADPNSPQILCAFEFLATSGSWCCRECFDAAKDAGRYHPVKRLQLLSS